MNAIKRGTTAAMEELPPVAEDIFEISLRDHERVELIGGHCDACDAYFFPRSDSCSHCYGDIGRISLGAEGTIYSFTIVRARPPLGLPRPYGVAYIDLEAVPFRVFCLLDPAQIDAAAIGASVHLAVGPLGVDNEGKPCLRPFFRLLTESGAA